MAPAKGVKWIGRATRWILIAKTVLSELKRGAVGAAWGGSGVLDPLPGEANA